MAPKVRTTSPALSGREDTQRADLSPSAQEVMDMKAPRRGKSSRKKKINWDKTRVFAQPELRVPYKLAMYRKGPNRGCAPELWVQAAVESGLVELGPPKDGSPPGFWLDHLDPKNKVQPPEGMNLDQMLLKFTSENIQIMDGIGDTKIEKT